MFKVLFFFEILEDLGISKKKQHFEHFHAIIRVRVCVCAQNSLNKNTCFYDVCVAKLPVQRKSEKKCDFATPAPNPRIKIIRGRQMRFL